MLDLALAIGHHLLIFAVFGIICMEFWAVRPGLSAATISRIGAIDTGYGLLAAAVLIVGFARAIFAAKGWSYYSHNAFFWAKLLTFALIGVLSLPPTLALIRWRRSGVPPGDAEVARIRRYLHSELGLFLFLPLFAAAMARGYGQF